MTKRAEILKELAGIEHLASPSIGAMQLMNDLNVDRDRLIRTIELDPALTVSLLRYANSAYFGCSREIHTIGEAVVRLGMKVIYRMLCMTTASNLSQRPVRGYDLPPHGLWHHLATTAVCTEIIAGKTGMEPPPMAFTAAILHDVGKLAMGTHLEIDAAPILELSRQESIPFDEAETRILGINHAEVGAELLAHWNLPEGIVEAVRWHHDPERFPGDKRTVDLVHVADAISMMAGTGLGIDGLRYSLCPESSERLGMSRNTVELVLCDLLEESAKLDPSP